MKLDHTISDNETFNLLFNTFLASLNFCQPGYVESYDPDTFTASIQPVFTDNYLLDDGKTDKLDYPVIPNVPVSFQGMGGGWYDYTPLEKGDPVILVCLQRSSDEWFASDGKTKVSPQDLRMMDPSDFIVIAGVNTENHKIAKADPKDRVLGHKDGKMMITLKADGTFTAHGSRFNFGSKSASTPLAKGNTTNDNFDAVKNKINEIITICSGTGGLLIPPPPPIATLSSVSSGKVFTND